MDEIKDLSGVLKPDSVVVTHDGVVVDDVGDDSIDIVQGFNYWMDGFWKVIGGNFRQMDHVKVEEYTFSTVGCNCIIPDVEFPVQKTWFTLTQPSDPTKFNRGNVSWVDGILVIQVDVQEAPCTIKWFNIY
jgi:hypothetical protein